MTRIGRVLRETALAAAVLLAGAAWTPAAAHPGHAPVLSPQLVASADRLDRIGARLKRANAELCASPARHATGG